MSFEHADEKKIPVKNLVHASANIEDAKNELKIWFSTGELYDYERSEDEHVI